MDSVKAARPEETVLQRSPTRSSQSLAEGKRAVRTVKEQFRKLRFQLEMKVGMKITPDLPIWSWIGRHAAWLYTRYRVRASGRTAYEEATDSSYKSEIAVFGEAMYFKEATSKTGQQQQHRKVKGADTTWRKGIWAGRAEATNEQVLSTEVGLRLTATVRRLPVESRFGRELIEESLGVPWDQMRGVQRGRPKRIPVPANAIPALPVAAPAAGMEPAPADEEAGPAEAAAPPSPRAQPPAAPPLAAQSPPTRQRQEEDDAMSAVPPTPGTPHSMGASPPQQSHARTAFLERERAEWRQQVEDPKRSRVAGVFGDGPTVEEPTELDEFIEDESEEVIEEGSWSADDELQAKTKHLREATDRNDSYEVVPGSTAGGLRLTTTWVMAI
jgi:hypothetical protein